MTSSSEWEKRKARAHALSVAALQLSEEPVGSTTAERRYKNALRQVFVQAHLAEDAASVMQARFERHEPASAGGPGTPTVLVVRFACELLRWTPQIMANHAGISAQVFRNFLSGHYCSRVAIDAILHALVQQGIDLDGLFTCIGAFYDQQQKHHGELAQQRPAEQASSKAAGDHGSYGAPPKADESGRPRPPSSG